VLDENLSAAQFVSTEDRSTLLHLPLSMAAYEEFSQLEVLLSEFSITDRADEWVYCWGGKYTSAKFYRDFYFCALGSLVVLSFPQPLNFSLVFPSL
jgi:hypothetical protein